jgi:hypothetical protein
MILAIIFTITANADNIIFTDIENHWAKDTVQELVNKEILNGYPDGNFKPDGNITRAEFSKVLRKSLSLELIEGNVFTDTQEHWAKDEINTLAENNIIIPEEYGESYNPDTNITRLEIAKMIVRALNFNTDIDVIELDFIDKDEISDDNIVYIYIASQNEIIKGYPDGSFKPDGQATRAESCKMIANMNDYIEENSVIESNDAKESNDSDDEDELDHLYDYTVVTTDGLNEETNEFNTKTMTIKDYYNERAKNSLYSFRYAEMKEKALTELDLLFNRDYENLPSDYKTNLDYHIFGRWYYRNERYEDGQFTELWIDECKKWNIKSEVEFLTNDDLVYINKDGKYTVRGILKIKYDSHDNIDKIQWEFEKEGTYLELGKWYETDVDITFSIPIISKNVVSREHSKYSLSMIYYLSDFMEIE